MARSDILVDCTGENCPIPLIETRKALNKAKPGDIVEIVGTNPASKKEIPMAVEALKLRLIKIEEEGDKWHIFIKK